MFTTSTTLVGILAAVLALRGGRFDAISYILLAASLGAYIRVAYCAWRGYRARSWFIGVDLLELYRFATESGAADEQIEWRIGDQLRKNIDDNGPAVTKKRDALDDLLPALLIQSVSLVLTLVVVAA